MTYKDRNIYASYCPHNNPIYMSHMCPGCRRQKRIQERIYYEEYMNNKRFLFIHTTDEPSNDKEFSTLKRSRSQEELKKEYYKMAKVHHPDKNGSEEKFKILQNLYEKLKGKFNM